MGDIIKAFDGKKSVLGILSVLALTICLKYGWVAQDMFDLLMPMAQALTGIGVVHKLAKIEKK